MATFNINVIFNINVVVHYKCHPQQMSSFTTSVFVQHKCCSLRQMSSFTINVVVHHICRPHQMSTFTLNVVVHNKCLPTQRSFSIPVYSYLYVVLKVGSTSSGLTGANIAFSCSYTMYIVHRCTQGSIGGT